MQTKQSARKKPRTGDIENEFEQNALPTLTDVLNSITDLKKEMNTKFDGVERKVGNLNTKLNTKFDGVKLAIGNLDKKLDQRTQVIPNNVFKNLDTRVFVVLNDLNEAVGVAFFLSETTAISAGHNVSPKEVGEQVNLQRARDYNVKPGVTHCIKTKIIGLNEDVDIAKLEVIQSRKTNIITPFVVCNNAESAISPNKKCALITLNVGLHGNGENMLSIVCTETSSKFSVGKEKIHYGAQTIYGDSGAPLISSETGEVIAIHLEPQPLRNGVGVGYRLDFLKKQNLL